MLAKRTIDNTECIDGHWAAADFKSHWGQRILGAIIMADAKRCFKRLDARTTARQPTPYEYTTRGPAPRRT